MITAEQWIQRLGLQKHPEGGYYRETYRAPERLSGAELPARYGGSDRRFSTSIYFLITGETPSMFHRVASDEIWHFHAGSSLTLHIINKTGAYHSERLGCVPDWGTAPQVIVPHDHWFGAMVDDPRGFSLVGCTVAPGFEFQDFEMAKRRELLALCPREQEVILQLTKI